MAFKPRPPNEDTTLTYVSTVTTKELNTYTEYADGCESDEYEGEEEVESPEHRPERKSFANKLSSAVKNFSLPSPEEIKNSTFYKSFQQPLIVKSKVQSTHVQQINQAVTMGKTPAELSRISKLSDFPLPSFKKHHEDKMANSVAVMEATSNGDLASESIYGTLTRSLRETKLITAVVETDADDETLVKRMELTKTMSPAQLSQIHSITEFPIPDKFKLKNLQAKPAENGHSAKENGKNEECNEDHESNEKHGHFLLPESFMETKLITNIKECHDYDTLRKRQEIVKTKTPKELSSISGLGDFPIPSKIENLMKKGGGSTPSGLNVKSLKDQEFEFSVPASLKINLAVTSKVEDEEIVKLHKELLESKTIAELSQISSLNDFPIPEMIENLMKKKDDTDKIKSSSLSLSRITSGKILPESLTETKLITNIKVEKDQERLQSRQNLVKNHTPAELGSIKNMSDFPIPSRLQHLTLPKFKGSTAKSLNDMEQSDSPAVPPRQKSCKDSIYESLPSSLRNEVIVRSRIITDEESKLRQELIRSKSPVELSQMSSLKDFPVPRTIEKLFENENQEEHHDEDGNNSFLQKFSTLPPSLKTNLLVGVKTEDQTLAHERSETIKSKSVSELSEIKSVSDIPVPSTLTRLAKRDYASAVERKKLFKQQMKSQSTQSLSLQGTLPRSLREKQLLVTSKFEDPDVLFSRRSLVESKSVAELSKVSSFGDFPVPGFLSKLSSKSLGKLDFMSNGHLQDPEEHNSNSKTGFYSTLPKSLNCELLVSKSVQDVSILEHRMQLINEKSTKELAQMASVKDFPVPDVIQRWYHKSMDRLHGVKDEEGLTNGVSTPNLKLPSMLTQPCIVTTKIEDPQVLMERQQIQQQKSIHELSKIRNLNDLPIPGNIITLPNVPFPKMKDILQLVARTPRKKSSPSLPNSLQVSPPESVRPYESSIMDEEEYSNIEDSYEVINKEKTESPQIDVDPEDYGLASQVKGTPERNTRNKKKKPESRNRRSHEEKEESATEMFETPPPLPPKRSPQKSMSVESQQSEEVDGSPSPIKGVLTLEAMNGNIQVTKNEVQSRPLPAPPAPARYGRVKESDRTIYEESQKFQTCRETLTTGSRTLIGTEDDDNTMADSLIESLVSCADTLICDDDQEMDDDDNPYPSVNFEGGFSELHEVEPPKTGKRLEEGTQKLSLELMEHVESLRSTLDNMSNRLGARSRSRSSSRPRSRPHSIHK